MKERNDGWESFWSGLGRLATRLALGYLFLSAIFEWLSLGERNRKARVFVWGVFMAPGAWIMIVSISIMVGLPFGSNRGAEVLMDSLGIPGCIIVSLIAGMIWAHRTWRKEPISYTDIGPNGEIISVYEESPVRVREGTIPWFRKPGAEPWDADEGGYYLPAKPKAPKPPRPWLGSRTPYYFYGLGLFLGSIPASADNGGVVVGFLVASPFIIAGVRLQARNAIKAAALCST
jgi:hypothetical protein